MSAPPPEPKALKLTPPNPSAEGRAFLVDAVGTVIAPIEPVTRTYARFAMAEGAEVSEASVRARLPTALASANRQALGDGRTFWLAVVTVTTGCPACFEPLYHHFAHPGAWRVLPGAVEAVQEMDARGWRCGLVSNFDTRLRPLIHGLGLGKLFAHMSVSGELGIDKPDPRIFLDALGALKSDAQRSVHVGDEVATDGLGAQAAAIPALIVGRDLSSLADAPEHARCQPSESQR